MNVRDISSLFRHGKKSVPFGYKWRISAPGIVINNPKIIDLFSYKFYGDPHKGAFGIVNYNPRHTYCPLVPNQYTLRAAKASPQVQHTYLDTLYPLLYCKMQFSYGNFLVCP